MLYIFHGSDISASLEKARTLINSLRAKRPDASYVEIDADHWNPSAIEEHLGGQGLFSNKYIIFLNRVTENAEAKEKIVDVISTMNESANIFIVLEGKLNAESKKAFEKSAEKLVVTEEKEAGSKEQGVGRKEEFNIFSLGDALGARDSMKAWKVYRQAIESGAEVESILGTLFWQAKSIALAAKANSAGETSLNPFVYSKSKKYAGNYSEKELSGLLNNLVKLYHDGHRGMVDMELGVERLLLRV